MTDVAKPVRPARFPWITVILSAVLFAILVALGTWQVERLHWKEDLLATIDARIHMAPAQLGHIEEIWAKDHDVEYWPVTVTGKLLNDRERHYFATYEGYSGFYVYTPLELSDGRAVFINRGFVPYDQKDPAKRTQGEVAGEVTVTGLARNPLTSKPSYIVPDNDLAKNIYYWKDMPTMAAQSGILTDELVPFFIDADRTPNPGGFPVGGVTIIDLPNSHLQYAVTWYGLAATLLVVLGISLRRRYKVPDDTKAESGA